MNASCLMRYLGFFRELSEDIGMLDVSTARALASSADEGVHGEEGSL